MAVVWSGTNKDPLVTLTGGALIATSDTTVQLENGRSDTFISGSMKVHWEVIPTSNLAANGSVGFANVTWDPTNHAFMGSDVNSLGYYDTGQVFVNFSTIATIGTYAQGNVIAMEADFGLGKLWCAVDAAGWNNDILANQNPATGTGGIPFTVVGSVAPSYSVMVNSGSPGVATLRALAASFTRAISAGFVALDAGAAVDTLMGQIVMG